MADRLTADIPRLAKLHTEQNVNWTQLEAETDDGMVSFDRIREATSYAVVVAEPSGATTAHTFLSRASAEAFVEGFKACAKLRRRAPKKKGGEK